MKLNLKKILTGITKRLDKDKVVKVYGTTGSSGVTWEGSAPEGGICVSVLIQLTGTDAGWYPVDYLPAVNCYTRYANLGELPELPAMSGTFLNKQIVAVFIVLG